jgi:uncharacterized protein YjdB
MATNVEIDLPATLVGLAGYVWLQDVGREDFINNEYAGTRDQGRRMEGFEVALVNPPGNLGLSYRVQVQNIGWMPWVDGGTYAGTQGQSLRCEAFEIVITGTGPDPLGYSVQYMSHLEDTGDIGPFSDGALCGTVGQRLRLEGMAVTIVHALGQSSQS